MAFVLQKPTGPDVDLLIHEIMYSPWREELSYREFWESTGSAELRRVFPKYCWDEKIPGARMSDDVRLRYFRSSHQYRRVYYITRPKRIWLFQFRAPETFEEKLAWIDHQIEVALLEIEEGREPDPEEPLFPMDGLCSLPPRFRLNWGRWDRANLIRSHAH